jgi:hypothetical protein
MILACRLKIPFTCDLKLIISFLVSHLIRLLFQLFKSLVSCCLEAAHSSHCVLSLGWLEGLVRVPYVPEKDTVQEAVSTMKDLQLKTSIGKDAALNFPMWNSSTKKAMLMHLTVILNTIKKRGNFNAYKEAQVLFVEKKKALNSANTSLSLLDGASKGSGKYKKTPKKAKEAKSMTKTPDNNMQATFQVDLKKAKSAAENTKGAMTASANKMFAFYTNFPSAKAK